MENQRICTICKIIKPFADFNWDKRFDLPFSRCKPCYNDKCRQYRRSKAGKENYASWLSDRGGRLVRKKALEIWHTKYPERDKAHSAVSNALRDKKIFRKPCEVCGATKVEAHHSSYEPENWLNVTWLCKKHHVEITYSALRSK